MEQFSQTEMRIVDMRWKLDIQFMASKFIICLKPICKFRCKLNSNLVGPPKIS